MTRNVRVEWAELRPVRDRNRQWYRLVHWPLWITVYFLSPGPLVFDLFAHGADWKTRGWLSIAMVGTGIAGWYGQLPGVEPRPYILRFTEDKPNPLYRRICYTFAWNVVANYAVLNLSGLLIACITGKWILNRIYRLAYFPIAIVIWTAGLTGNLPRVKPSTKGEGWERRYFYGSVWAVCAAQPLLGILWRTLPQNRKTNWIKLGAFVGTFAGMAALAVRGDLPRTRAILPGESMVAD